MKRIAVFQAYHSLQVHTLNVVRYLRSAGYAVDLFVFKCGTRVHSIPDDIGQVFDHSGLVKDWNESRTVVQRIASAIRFFVLEPLAGGPLLHERVLEATREHVRRHSYTCFIGIEKMGMVWASVIGETTHVPVYYYSLELYGDNHVRHISWTKRLRFMKMRRLEKKHYRNVHRVIVQDQARAEELDRMNGAAGMPHIDVPVSLIGEPVCCPSDHLRKRLEIPERSRVILQFGLIDRHRMSVEITRAAQSLPDGYVLVMHGYADDPGIIGTIAKENQKGKVIISSDFVPEEMIDELISSADIALCFYSAASANERLAGFSSEKLARYLKCGVPVIAFAYPSFVRSVEQTGCGVCISDLSGLSNAVATISQEYEYFRSNAFKAYELYFRFEVQIEKLTASINEL